MKTISTFILAITTALYCLAVPPPPYSEKKYEIDEIYRNLYDLNGKVIKITYKPDNPRQDSPTSYGDSVYGQKEVAYIRFPKEVGDARFRNKKDEIKPFMVYVQVTIATLANQFGGSREGAILIAVGRETRQGISGPVTYTW
ncbi:hypothetical protein OPIT5_02555 [Opitutaceae bacterium TAV5]|nr:hypothetical protein OPIT5_02555 [Opitutaceae bacterium TAV5]